MTTTITLPDHLASQLQRQALVQRRSVESLVIEYIEARLKETALPTSVASNEMMANDAELLELVARIKATPPNSVRTTPSQGKFAELLAVMVHGEPDQALLDTLDAAELELRAINRADDIAEGRA
ncbi:MAG: hypothetical protein WCJ55_16170 [Chloroflexales bacterium]